jgi:D-tyrosyl-tRNA(Tyr) deacylase
MIAVAQRVRSAAVSLVEADAASSEVGRIGRGLCVLLGIERGDGEADADAMARKLARLRVFPDDAGRFDRDLPAVGGGVLLVSQFTLCGDCSQGNRPSFTQAAPPEAAEPLFQRVGEALRKLGVPVETGRFRRTMLVSIENDGPVTILLRATGGVVRSLESKDQASDRRG